MTDLTMNEDGDNVVIMAGDGTKFVLRPGGRFIISHEGSNNTKGDITVKYAVDGPSEVLDKF